MMFWITVIVVSTVAVAALLTWLWWFDETEPGRHRLQPIPVILGQHPYPPLTGLPLSAFPGEDNPPRVPEQTQRLYDTGELRQLAYAGDMTALAADTAQFKALNDLDRWTR